MPTPGLYAPAQLAETQTSPRTSIDPSKALTLSLEELLTFANEHAPSIQTARAQTGLGNAEVVGARIAFPMNPQLRTGVGVRTVGSQTGLEYELAIQQQLELVGQQALRLEATQDQQQVLKAAVDEVRWRVRIEVRRLFFALLLAQERIAQARRFVAFAESMSTIATRQVDAGESSRLITLVADADVAQTKAALVTAQQAKNLLKVRLVSILGWPTDTLPDVRGSLPKIRSVSDVDSLLRSMVRSHPSFRTRELAVMASRSRLALEERESWPDPIVGISYGREAAPGPEAEADIVMFNLTLPLPIWHTNQKARAQANAELIVADRLRKAAAIRLRGELHQAIVALNAAAERVALYEETIVPRLEKNLSLVQQAFELGEIDAHQVSQTRQRLLSAMSQYIDARIIYYDAATTLEGLVGTEQQLDQGGLP